MWCVCGTVVIFWHLVLLHELWSACLFHLLENVRDLLKINALTDEARTVMLNNSFVCSKSLRHYLNDSLETQLHLSLEVSLAADIQRCCLGLKQDLMPSGGQC